MTQSIAGIHELVGSDVNLVHRLLKNQVGEKTGWRAYALFTGQSLEHLVTPCDPRDLHSHTEHYEHLGEVLTYSLDLHKRYDELSTARHVVVADDEADAIMDYDFPVSPAVLWDYLSEPSRRDLWMAGVHWSAGARPGGRTSPGAQNHYYFGKNNYWAVTHKLTPMPDGRRTHLHIALRGHIGNLPHARVRQPGGSSRGRR